MCANESPANVENCVHYYIMPSSTVFTVCTVQYALLKSIDIYFREKASLTISRFKIIAHH